MSNDSEVVPTPISARRVPGQPDWIMVELRASQIVLTVAEAREVLRQIERILERTGL